MKSLVEVETILELKNLGLNKKVIKYLKFQYIKILANILN